MSDRPGYLTGTPSWQIQLPLCPVTEDVLGYFQFKSLAALIIRSNNYE